MKIKIKESMCPLEYLKKNNISIITLLFITTFLNAQCDTSQYQKIAVFSSSYKTTVMSEEVFCKTYYLDSLKRSFKQICCYHETQSKAVEFNVIDSMQNGEYKVWFSNGVLARIEYFVLGREVSLSCVFNKQGKLILKGHFSTNADYYLNDSIINYIDTIFESDNTQEYYSVAPRIYKNIKIGTWQFWDENGKLVKEEIYNSNGKLIRKINY